MKNNVSIECPYCKKCFNRSFTDIIKNRYIIQYLEATNSNQIKQQQQQQQRIENNVKMFFIPSNLDKNENVNKNDNDNDDDDDDDDVISILDNDNNINSMLLSSRSRTSRNIAMNKALVQNNTTFDELNRQLEDDNHQSDDNDSIKISKSFENEYYFRI
jgi:hypothetical protein